MNEEQQLKVQAFVDGELPEREARDVAAWLARDADAAALVTELRHTRKALSGFEEPKLPESRDFYWSKIQRQIQREEARQEPRIQKASFFTLLRRVLAPAGATAVLAIVMIAAFMQFNTLDQQPVAAAPDAETISADTGTFTYNDYASGTTLVWLSYPAESQFAQNTAN